MLKWGIYEPPRLIEVALNRRFLNFIPEILANKLVRAKMRPKEGAKIELMREMSDSVRFVRFAGLNLSDLPISAIKKKRQDCRMDGPTDGRTDRRTDRQPLIEMRGCI